MSERSTFRRFAWFVTRCAAIKLKGNLNQTLDKLKTEAIRIPLARWERINTGSAMRHYSRRRCGLWAKFIFKVFKLNEPPQHFNPAKQHGTVRLTLHEPQSRLELKVTTAVKSSQVSRSPVLSNSPPVFSWFSADRKNKPLKSRVCAGVTAKQST